MRAHLSIAALLTTTACAATPAPDGDPRPAGGPTVLYHGPRFLLPDGTTVAGVLVDTDGRITHLFPDVSQLPHGAAATGMHYELIPGALALPGLVDGHLHVMWIGRSAEQLDVSGAKSVAEVRERVAAYRKAHPELGVIVGDGWDQTLWGTEFPTADDLGPSDVPVLLSRVDGHALWLDRSAMARAHSFFDAPPAAAGMRIERTADGAPTGVVIDPVQALWDLIVPAPREVDYDRWIAAGLDRCADSGLVEVHDMATSPAELASLQRLAARGLPLRVIVYLDDSGASYAWLAAHPNAPRVLGPELIVAGVKLFADGALGSRGAALKADYSDEHGHLGQPTGREQLISKAVRAAKLGYPVAIHAIGDLGNAHALDAIEAANLTRPGLAHRIEHAQVIDLADLDRFVSTRAIASMQPTHATSDMRWAEARVGPDRIRGAYAWQTLLRRGIPLAFGSDAPVESEAPLAGLFAAIFRKTAAGDPPGGWRPSEALTFAEALHAFTAGAVAAAPGENRRGRIEIGAPFDVTLLDRDVAADPSQLLQAKVLGTMRGQRAHTP